MLKQYLQIEQIPAILWGEKTDHLIVAVHGNKSNKEDDVIAVFAACAIAKGYQVLSFDLPGHGERRGEEAPLKAQNGVQDLETVMRYARKEAGNISLFACSVGAYFSLLAYKHVPLRQALFLSPLVDMERTIHNMMAWFHVSEDTLKTEQEVATPIGQPLYWDYYRYVKEHPVTVWNVPTAILYGTKDDTVEYDTVGAFAKRFHADVQIMEHGEHYFHTKEQLAFFSEWCTRSLPAATNNETTI